ncbi:MAG: hypothetical protein IIA60_08060 [Candidatus Marinimicrobia bacterium]|nr:hypothetical protein [Candidatus Neomarinimicrobiota bacterium]
MKNKLSIMLMALLFIWSCDKQSTEPDEIKERANYTETNSSLPDNHVLSILIDSENNKWIGTANGLARLKDDNWQIYNTQNSGIPSDYIAALAEDNSGNIWIGTGGSYIDLAAGLAVFDGTDWTTYNSSNSDLPVNAILCLKNDPGGAMWIGTDGGGLVKIEGSNWTIFDTNNSQLPTNRVSALDFDHDGNLWVGTISVSLGDTTGGVGVYNGESWTVYRTDNSGLPSNDVLSIHVDNSGSKWIGTLFSDGLAKLSNNSWEIYGLSTGLYLGVVSDICSDEIGNVWFAGAFLYKYDGSQWTKIALPSELYSEASGFQGLACDSDGSIWVCSFSDGLFMEPNNSD